MSQINSYVNQINSIYAVLSKVVDFAPFLGTTRRRRVEVAGIFPGFFTSNLLVRSGHPEQTRSREIAWGKAQVCWSSGGGPQDWL